MSLPFMFPALPRLSTRFQTTVTSSSPLLTQGLPQPPFFTLEGSSLVSLSSRHIIPRSRVSFAINYVQQVREGKSVLRQAARISLTRGPTSSGRGKKKDKANATAKKRTAGSVFPPRRYWQSHLPKFQQPNINTYVGDRARFCAGSRNHFLCALDFYGGSRL